MAIIFIMVVLAIILAGLVFLLGTMLSLYVSTSIALAASRAAGGGTGLSLVQSLKVACLIGLPVMVFWFMSTHAMHMRMGTFDWMSEYNIARSMLMSMLPYGGMLVGLLAVVNWERNPIAPPLLRLVIATAVIMAYLLANFSPYGVLPRMEEFRIPRDAIYVDWVSYFIPVAAPLIVIPTILGRAQRVIGALGFAVMATASLMMAFTWLAV